MKILYYSGWTLGRVVPKLLFRIKITGQDNIPASGPFILAGNHISYFDPLLFGSWIDRQVYFLAKEELFRNRLFGSLISRTNALPIRRGMIDRAALDRCLQVLTEGYGLTVFPEGTRSRTDQFLSPKAGIGLVATRAKCPIIPAYIHGSNRLWACLWGKERLSIIYGEPIPAEVTASYGENKEGYLALAGMVMDRIGQLRDRRLALDQRRIVADN
jgi:1-acyl-sn-glycerol-3-phosphate acyltransferase